MFEISKVKKKNKIENKLEYNKLPFAYKSISNFQEREVRNIIHATLKNVVKKRKEKDNLKIEGNDFEEKNEISWETFRNLKPNQIFGMISLNPHISKKFNKIFEKKEKHINFVFSQFKIIEKQKF